LFENLTRVNRTSVPDPISKIPYGGYVLYVRINSAVFYFFVARTKAESATGRRLVGDWSATGRRLSRRLTTESATESATESPIMTTESASMKSRYPIAANLPAPSTTLHKLQQYLDTLYCSAVRYNSTIKKAFSGGWRDDMIQTRRKPKIAKATYHAMTAN